MRPPWHYDRRSPTREELRRMDIQRTNAEWSQAIFEPALYQLNRSLIEDMIDMEAI